MKKFCEKFKVFKRWGKKKLEEEGISKKELIAVNLLIWNPLWFHIWFLPTAIAAVYVAGRIIFIRIIRIMRKTKPQEL